MWKVPLSDVVISEEEIADVTAVYRSGWLTMGPRTEEFEQAFAEYAGTSHAVALSSATAGLHLGCLACGLGAGDEVIVPSLTFVATANAVRYTGATPVFAEIRSLEEPWLSADSVAQQITSKTRAVIPVHYGGHVGELERIRELCERHGIMLIEDAAHAAGSRLGGRHLGTFGEIGVFSFFSNKNLAVGEGGVAVTNSDEIVAKLRLLRSHGMTAPTWDRHKGHASDYDVAALGFNYRMDEVRAALATRRLSKLDTENLERKALVDRYRESLSDLPLTVTMGDLPSLTNAYHLFTVVLEPGIDQASFRAAMREQGVQTSLHYPPIHKFSAYSEFSDLSLPLTEEYAKRSVTLPLFAHMSEAQQREVVRAVRESFAKLRPRVLN
jgi:dTDP-4-amino-4,6-dideoxygalactose transaminase